MLSLSRDFDLISFPSEQRKRKSKAIRRQNEAENLRKAEGHLSSLQEALQV
jgi:hypothetical protein